MTVTAFWYLAGLIVFGVLVLMVLLSMKWAWDTHRYEKAVKTWAQKNDQTKGGE